MASNTPKTAKMRKNIHEFAAWEAQKFVVGLDEVGRGCLAGPLVTAAVILPINKAHRQLKDSKVMEPEERLIAYRWIVKNCHFGIGIVHHRIIDEHNIYGANLIAMQKALVNLMAIAPERPIAILSDAVPLKLLDTAFRDIPVHSFPKGEKYSSSIAAASIIAKVTRDNMMEKLDRVFPGYKLGQHKGYSTAIHQTAVRSLGPSIIHRMSFLSKVLSYQEPEIQGNLFSAINSEEIILSVRPDASTSSAERRALDILTSKQACPESIEGLEGHFNKIPNPGDLHEAIR